MYFDHISKFSKYFLKIDDDILIINYIFKSFENSLLLIYNYWPHFHFMS